MRVICVDDEQQTLQNTLALCREITQITAADGFTEAREALKWMENHPVELAVLDINMPGMDGFTLARAIRDRYEGTEIVFVTAHPQYAVDAWAIHPTGFVVKPLTRERLQEEVEYALRVGADSEDKGAAPHVEVRTFGNFDLIVDGRKISFPRSKAKELLACLVDRRGIRMTRAEAFHLLWGEEEYSRSRQKMLDVIIRSLRATLEENGVGGILQIEQGALRVVPEKLDCDLYRLLRGERDTIREYQGEYMSAYAWASVTEGRIEAKLRSLTTV
ncbi:MAG: response regulator [Oscillospiraceae bacterium]|nr:response regulator [Oscillospiraceae bacterium]